MSELWLAFWTLVGIPFRRWLGGGLFECSRIWKLLFLALCVFCMYLTSHQLDFKSYDEALKYAKENNYKKIIVYENNKSIIKEVA